MLLLDWVCIAVLLVSLLLGAWRGLVYEVVSVASWIAAFFLAQWFAMEAGQALPLSGASETVRYALGFALVFVGSVLVGGLVAVLAKKLFAVIGLQPVDRVLGACFGLVRGLVLLLAATVVIGMTPMKSSEWWRESTSAGVLTTSLKGLKPLLPEESGKYLP
ncbi:CvpA family protein [Rhodoferax sp.]|uniref:CvpA family protein n=1 Tax=Rhodoferax sp. TaxID=50421 RepID=UPI0027582367|nr:CvpA family protein [Rhodoferax sp.]